MEIFIHESQTKMRVSKELISVMFITDLNIVIDHCEGKQKQSCLVVQDFKIVTVLQLI